MGTIAELVGMLFGSILAVYWFVKLVNFIAKKITKRDSVKQKIISVIIATIFSIMISGLMSLTINTSIWNIFLNSFFYIIGGLIACFRIALSLRLRYFFLAVLYGLPLWVITTLLINGALLALCPGFNQLSAAFMGYVIMTSSLIVSSILVIKQKLPWSKRKA